MNFVSFDYYLLFLPVVVGLYYVFRTSILANVVILAASYIFYGSSGLWFLAPLIVTSLIDFYVGLKLATIGEWRKTLLAVSLIANLGLLAFFKYTPWLINSINEGLAAAGLSIALPALSVVLPPGISFYTFQTMSYTIEIYRREMKPTRDIISYMAFVTFWPHLVAGPIMRARNLLLQLQTIRPVISSNDAYYALLLISWGLFKRCWLTISAITSTPWILISKLAWSGRAWACSSPMRLPDRSTATSRLIPISPAGRPNWSEWT
jgi:alginate O-acetyltransferase complex protein AlgI